MAYLYMLNIIDALNGNASLEELCLRISDTLTSLPTSIWKCSQRPILENLQYSWVRVGDPAEQIVFFFRLYFILFQKHLNGDHLQKFQEYPTKIVLVYSYHWLIYVQNFKNILSTFPKIMTNNCCSGLNEIVLFCLYMQGCFVVLFLSSFASWIRAGFLELQCLDSPLVTTPVSESSQLLCFLWYLMSSGSPKVLEELVTRQLLLFVCLLEVQHAH